MKQTFAQQAGYEVEKNSDLEIRMQVLAGEIYSSFANIEWLKRQVFPQTATGEYLTMHGTQKRTREKGVSPSGSRKFNFFQNQCAELSFCRSPLELFAL